MKLRVVVILRLAKVPELKLLGAAYASFGFAAIAKIYNLINIGRYRA